MALKDKLQEAIAYKPLQYGLIVLAVGGLVYWIAWQAGKRRGLKSDVKYPSGPDTVTDAWKANQGRAVVSALFEAIDGLSTDDMGKAAAMQPLLALTDAQVKWVMTEYQARYSRSLIADIEGEYLGFNSSLKSKVLYRLKNLQTAA
jgi:hypothetical protein